MKALIVGYGSIGMRHTRVLSELGLEVAVVSRRELDNVRCFGDLARALADWQPRYVVVADETQRHAATLTMIARSAYDGLLLVEKPLFCLQQVLPEPLPHHSFVGYNLRFHPLLQELRRRLASERVLSLSAYAGQYLPDWRPGTDYRKCYSARREEGGGVLRDLSHELDYLIWLAGGWTRATAQGGKVSQLEIDSDDVFEILFQSPGGALANARINYLDRKVRRELLIHTETHSFRLDFVAGSLACDEDTETLDVPRDLTYREQHRAILAGRFDLLCSLEQGNSVMALITAAEKAAQQHIWIDQK
jgi:predicted dehydrogenase